MESIYIIKYALCVNVSIGIMTGVITNSCVGELGINRLLSDSQYLYLTEIIL